MNKHETQEALEQPRFKRKILLDSHVYCQYSMRQSNGDPHCDHDFEQEPDVAEASHAIWNCTICGRAVRFETWN